MGVSFNGPDFNMFKLIQQMKASTGQVQPNSDKQGPAVQGTGTDTSTAPQGLPVVSNDPMSKNGSVYGSHSVGEIQTPPVTSQGSQVHTVSGSRNSTASAKWDELLEGSPQYQAAMTSSGNTTNESGADYDQLENNAKRLKDEGDQATTGLLSGISEGRSSITKSNQQRVTGLNAGRTATRAGNTAAKLGARLKKESQKEQTSIITNQKAMQNEQAAMFKLDEEMDEIMSEIEDLSSNGDNTGVGERSAYSLQLAGGDSDSQPISKSMNSRTGVSGGSQSTSASTASGAQSVSGNDSDGTNARMDDLIDKYGKKASQAKRHQNNIGRLNIAGRKHVKTAQTSVKRANSQNNTLGKVLKGAGIVASATTAVGGALKLFGVSLGTASKTGHAIGAAEQSAGIALISTIFGAAFGALVESLGIFTQTTSTVGDGVSETSNVTGEVTTATGEAATQATNSALQTVKDVTSTVSSAASAAQQTADLFEKDSATTTKAGAKVVAKAHNNQAKLQAMKGKRTGGLA